MMYWSFTFLVISIVAAIFGFGIVAATTAQVGKALAVLFFASFVVSMGLSFSQRKPS